MEPFGFYIRVLNLLLPSFLDLVLQKSATKSMQQVIEIVSLSMIVSIVVH